MRLNWNYRIVRRETGFNDSEPFYYGIHEAYYPKDGSSKGQPDMITAEPCELDALTVEELRTMLIRMLLATTKPILDYETFFNDNPLSPEKTGS